MSAATLSQVCVTPAKSIVFAPTNAKQISSLTIENWSDQPVIYKITPSREGLYKIVPVCGQVSPLDKLTVNITMQGIQTGSICPTSDSINVAFAVAPSNISNVNKMWHDEKFKHVREQNGISNRKIAILYNGVNDQESLPAKPPKAEIDDSLRDFMAIVNSSARRIGWAIFYCKCLAATLSQVCVTPAKSVTITITMMGINPGTLCPTSDSLNCALALAPSSISNVQKMWNETKFKQVVEASGISNRKIVVLYHGVNDNVCEPPKPPKAEIDDSLRDYMAVGLQLDDLEPGPGDVVTQPGTKIVFNAPYDDKHTYHIKIVNSSARSMGWAIKTTNMKRLGVDPGWGVLDPKEAILMAVFCDAFAYGHEYTKNDRITIESTNTPDGAAKHFRREWFQGDGLVRRKNLPIEYNP